MFNENINGQELYDTDFDSLDDDSQSGYTGPPEPIRKTCGRCGQANLIWKNFDGKWKLAECSISGPHQCNNDTQNHDNIRTPEQNQSKVRITTGTRCKADAREVGS